ncbi:MAG: glycerophosphodiester phosphodiesterase [Candidatus Rokuibacteriota bacterium]
MRATASLKVLLLSIVAFLVVGVPLAESGRKHLQGTVDQLLGLEVGPFAIGHRGFGENLGEDPSRPIENTVAAVRKGFRAGLSVVEVDVQLTRDGEVAVFHDDFLLPDFTCLNTLTLSELQARLPHVPSLQAVLRKARTFNQASGPLQGLVIVELKAPAPLCDPNDRQERAIVSAVVRVIRRMGMTGQVMLASFSPALLSIAAKKAPDITRILTISGLQFLTEEEVEFLLGLEVTPIDKRRDLGLQWAEIGLIFRLPGYGSLEEDAKAAIQKVLLTAAVTGARVIEADLFFLSLAGAPFVDASHGYGLKVLGFTARNRTEWLFLESLEVDGIYTNDVPLGVDLQATIP